MLGYKQSPTLEAIDQAFLTRRRILRDVQIALLITFMFVAAFVHNVPELIVLSVVFIVASVLVRPAVQRLINSAVPRAVRARLPYGPLDVEETPGAPHTYRDLFRIWRDPAWQCEHKPNLRVPVSATNAAIGVPALILFSFAALGVAGEVMVATGAFGSRASHKVQLSIAIAVTAVAAQLAVTASWNRALRKRSVDLPTAGDVWITLFIAAAAVLVGLAVAFAVA